MGRKKRAGFGDVVTDRATFERGAARCPSCRRPIGPEDNPTPVHTFGSSEVRLMTMRCGRCDAMLTVRFEGTETAAS